MLRSTAACDHSAKTDHANVSVLAPAMPILDDIVARLPDNLRFVALKADARV
jgi:hypothetical protein